METLNKYLLTDKQANLWKFVVIYKRYQNKQLNANEWYKYNYNLHLLKAENKQLNELINDDHFLDHFIFNWENGRQKW